MLRRRGRTMRSSRNLFRNSDGGMALLMTAGLGVIVIMGGGLIDYMSLSNQRMSLQGLADRAALAAAQELIVSAGAETRVAAVAQAMVKSAALDVEPTTEAKIIEDGQAVTVSLAAKPKTFFAGPLSGIDVISAEATAEVSGGGYVCMIGLDPSSVATLNMMKNSRLKAEKCAIYSNSKSSKSLWLHDSSRVSADLICVAGGVEGPDDYFALAKPVEDCPALADPLRFRPNPDVGDLEDCDFKNMNVKPGETVTLKPGIYCNGLTVMGNATLEPGIYVMSGGRLMVDGGGTLEGKNVGFFLSGPAATIKFGKKSRVSLTAPRKGDMAGILFFEDRDTEFAANHQITSDDARNLVGTIYLPKSKLLIDASNAVADKSDYTIIIAREFELRDGPELVLNADYAGSTIPVPEGVGNKVKASAQLVR